MVRINDFDFVVELNVGSGDNARAFLGKVQGYLVATVHVDRQPFQVEQDLNDIFLDAFDCAVLMQNAIDFGLYHGAAGHGREQNATQRIAQGMTETTLQRLKSDLGARGRSFLYVDMTRS